MPTAGGKESDKYADMGSAEKKERSENRKKMITQQGFRYASPGKRGCGTGSWVGCFGAQSPMPEPSASRKGEIPSKKEGKQPKNIMTSPGKKGTYGFNNITLGKQLEYKDEPYEERKKQEKADREKKNKLLGPSFKGTCKSMDFFDSHPNVAASKIYTIDTGKLPAPRKPEPPKKPITNMPFKPAQSSREYFSLCPHEDAPPNVPKRAVTADSKKGSVTWKPCSSFSASLPIKSIAHNPTAINISVAKHGM